ncbi:MAG: biopolymer transporter ExbD [Gammaproteobacteria bacterium]|nr:biopolymer transporter ExbD [Gammaproteobacteria bacterium]
MKRMSRNKGKIPKMNLTSLMDVFTILVFFLLVNSGQSEIMEAPKQVTLPESVVESKPRETVVIHISPEEVVVQGESVMSMADVAASRGRSLEPIQQRLAALKGTVIGRSTQVVAASQEVTVLADKSIPFDVIERVLSTCTGEGYTRISLAVTQKVSETTES